MRTSDNLNEIAPALVGAQRTLKNPKPDAKGQVRGRQDYSYLSLPALLDAVRGVFREVGLVVVQELVESPTGIGCVTRIIHLSGQFIETGPLVLPVSGGPQDFGSAATYCRRYSLAAAVGLAADEDDDAQTVRASSNPPRDTAVSGPGSHSTPTSGNGEGPGEGGAESAGEASGVSVSPADFRFTAGQYEGWLCSEVAEADPGWLRVHLQGLTKPENRAYARAILEAREALA